MRIFWAVLDPKLLKYWNVKWNEKEKATYFSWKKFQDYRRMFFQHISYVILMKDNIQYKNKLLTIFKIILSLFTYSVCDEKLKIEKLIIFIQKSTTYLKKNTFKSIRYIRNWCSNNIKKQMNYMKSR